MHKLSGADIRNSLGFKHFTPCTRHSFNEKPEQAQTGWSKIISPPVNLLKGGGGCVC